MADFIGIPITHPPGPLQTPASTGAQPRAGEASPEARHAAQEFESVFLTEMMQPMFEGIGTDGLGEGGEGEQMFRPMLLEQYAASIAKSGGVGIAANILHELTRLQTTPADAASAQAGDAQAIELRAGALRLPPIPTDGTHGADR